MRWEKGTSNVIDEVDEIMQIRQKKNNYSIISGNTSYSTTFYSIDNLPNEYIIDSCLGS